MNPMNSVRWLIPTTLAVTGAAFAVDQDNAVLTQIASLKAEIASLKTTEGDQWLTEQRAAEIRGIVTDVLADADSRTSLQGAAAGSGYNGGFFLSSADGNYSMKVNVLEQIRWTYDNASDSSGGDSNSWGFENKRTRLSWSGNVVDSTWTYKLAYYFAYANDLEFAGANTVLADAWVAKDLGNGLSLTVGQFSLPYCAEACLDAGMLQFNDYSTVSTMFSDNYGQGLMLSYASDSIAGSIAYVNSLNEVNAQFSSDSPDDELGLSGRLTYKASGEWAQFCNAQSFKGESAGMLFGAGFSWEESNDDESGVFSVTADATLDFGGANVIAAFYYDDLKDAVGESTNPYGFTLQGGVFVADDCELVARYEWGSTDEGSDDEFSALTFGANWYMAQNTAKFGANFGYAFDSINSDWAAVASGNNWLEDESGEDGQWMIQAQLSFSF